MNIVGYLKNWVAQGKDEARAGWIVPLMITLLLGGGMYYWLLPALNIKSLFTWFFVLFLVFMYVVEAVVYAGICRKKAAISIPLLILGIGVLALCAIGVFGSTRVFHAKAYSEILQVEMAETDVIPSVSESSSIALMDTASAQMLGDRRIGSLGQLVSQYNVDAYTQINYMDAPCKVAPLAYDGFFKWRKSNAKGIPGYVKVDPVDMSADYVSFSVPMKYVPSAWLVQNLERRIRFQYPALMFDYMHFEVDEEGNPWYVASIIDHKVGLFGGEAVTGAVIANPVNGDVKVYDVSDIPVWVDVVFPGDLICQQYNDYAQLAHGFLNSVFSQTDCRQVTTLSSEDDDGDVVYMNDYGYIAKDGDIFIYTGITSVNGDSSNIGFILANERTSKTLYIPCSGADEFSGMRSAEGEVQEKRYAASFPSLINVEGVLTYIMVLKDGSGLVKLYAAVNVEQYNNVVTAPTQAECIRQYRRLVSGGKANDSFARKTIVIDALQAIDIDGNTYLYVKDEEGNIYHARYVDVLGMLGRQAGETIVILTDGDVFVLPE